VREGRVKKRNIKSICVSLMAVLLLFAIWLDCTVADNENVVLTQIRVESPHLPKAFDGFRIAQISDLHNAQIGEDNIRLLNKLREADADIIVITGDMIDSRRTDVETALHVAREAVKLAPTYYIRGNHEDRMPKAYAELKAGLLACGVTVLENESAQIERGNEEVQLVGMPNVRPMLTVEIAEKLDSLASEDMYTILLAHTPQYFNVYTQHADLTFCGHVHGGQIRLPWVGGVYGPGQGFFPTYDSGLYTQGENSMIVSRGIGNSLFPLRVNNTPEIVVAELVCKQQ